MTSHRNAAAALKKLFTGVAILSILGLIASDRIKERGGRTGPTVSAIGRSKIVTRHGAGLVGRVGLRRTPRALDLHRPPLAFETINDV